MSDNSDKRTVQLYSEKELDIIAKMATSTAMALSTNFSLERKMLNILEEDDSLLQLDMRVSGNLDLRSFDWIEIRQVGKSADDSFDACFTALQNILRAFQLPHTRLTFLITGENRYFRLYLGLCNRRGSDRYKRFDSMSELSSFCNVSWPGMKTNVVGNIKGTGIESFSKGKYDRLYAITGIPSMDLDKTKYPSTLEYLMGGCKPKGKIAYLVVAEPIDETEINNIIYSCEEMSGQAESFKSFSITDSIQKGTTDTITKSITKTIGKSSTKGTSKRDTAATVITGLVGIGLTLGAVAFPPIGAVAALGGGAAGMIGAASVVGLLNSLIPQKSKSETVTEQDAKSSSIAHGVSENYSMSLGSTVVNGHVNSVIELLKAHHDRFMMGKAKGMWQVGCYLFTDKDNSTSHIQLKSILSGSQSRLEPIRVHDITSLLINCDDDTCMQTQISSFVTPPKLCVVSKKDLSIFEHPFGNRFSYLTTCLTTDELTSMVNFPLHSLPGISVAEVFPDFKLDITGCEPPRINIGNLLYRGENTNIPCVFSLDNLTRHGLICGTNGSGKTNTVLGILKELSDNNRNFMVIEPAKTEYMDWAIKFNETLGKDQKRGLRLGEKPVTIYMPGKSSYWHADKDGNSVEYTLSDVLKLNPFEPVALDGKIPDVVSHLDRIKSIFSLAFPMEDILPTVMESLLRDVYTNGEKWLKRKKDDKIPEYFPTLGLLACRIRSVISSLGYEPRVTANIYAAINLRLSNLLSGWKRELLNNEVLGGYKKLSKTETETVEGIRRPTWDDFFNRKVVINLSGVADDNDRAFVMGILLLYLYEYRIATSERKDFNFNKNKLEHLTVVEEAHRVMMNNPNPDSPQFKCGQLFSNLLSEIRAYGEGMMIVDQVPGRLIPDAVKNTNLKIIHRLISYDDIELVSKSMGISEEQQKVIPKLGIGQAVVAGICTGNDSDNSTEDIYWCKINKTKPN